VIFDWQIEPALLDPTTKLSALDGYGTLRVPSSAPVAQTYTITAARMGGISITRHIQIAKTLPCFIAVGDVDVASLPSDINISLNVKTTAKSQTQAPKMWQHFVRPKPRQR
jgi:hypothetical protein